MAQVTAPAPAPVDDEVRWHARPVDEVAVELGTNVASGLTSAEAGVRLSRIGPNELPKEPAPSRWAIAAGQWRDPMNVLLTVIGVASVVAGQGETGLLVACLVLLNVVLGTRQEVAARASVDALESLNVPSARARRDGQVVEVSATDLVPGDLLVLEAGDIVPADARILESAGLEAMESALTGESVPVEKCASEVLEPDAALGDRVTMVFQTTSITRGTATAIVTATGSGTEVGRIAGLLGGVERASSPLQQEIRDLTFRLAWMCLAAVAYIVVIGLVRGLDADDLILVAIVTAISAIPSGLPTFLTAMLSYGSRRLAQAKAVVRNLTDVEALGSVSAINSDKTGTLTLDRMTATRLFDNGQWFIVQGTGYSKSGSILHAAGGHEPDFTTLGYGLTLCSDATVSDDGGVVGDPTEAALVVLAAKMGVDADLSRRELPRLAVVPFDSSYKFMATFHRASVPDGAPESIVGLVKGAPDVVLAHCASAAWEDQEVPIEEVRERIVAANGSLAEQGLRVLAFAYRRIDLAHEVRVQAAPMAEVNDLVFVGLVGIIDPLRPSAKEAIGIALDAGIDVRMITGDHAVTAKAIGDDLGLGPGVITGPQFQQLSDEELASRLPDLHVFGRVAPADKLRLVSVMQERGTVVAMTGDAVNDAAALKKADIGVAMGSGAEVSKQAAKMVLTDDNFATLVHAIELGRDIYTKIASQIRYVMVGLFGVLGLMLLATTFDINGGQALSAVQLLFVTFLIGIFPALAISTDHTESGLMSQRPRDPASRLLNRTTTPRWVAFGLVQALVGLAPFALGLGDGQVLVEQSMVFAVMSVSTVLLAMALRRNLTPLWVGPFTPYVLWLLIPLAASWLGVEAELFQGFLDTASLTGPQWAQVFALSGVPAVAIEIDKAIRRRRS
ncbi:MAG: cation-transporting P-type ATPase [Jiangellales bacterium]